MTDVQRSWQKASFWLDTLERTVRTFIVVLLSILAATTDWPQDWSDATWRGLIYATVGTFLMCLLASGFGESGTASVMNPAPPDTLKEDKGNLSLQDLLVVTAIAVLAAVILYFIIT
jgi:hypothetical protein